MFYMSSLQPAITGCLWPVVPVFEILLLWNKGARRGERGEREERRERRKRRGEREERGEREQSRSQGRNTADLVVAAAYPSFMDPTYIWVSLHPGKLYSVASGPQHRAGKGVCAATLWWYKIFKVLTRLKQEDVIMEILNVEINLFPKNMSV